MRSFETGPSPTLSGQGLSLSEREGLAKWLIQRGARAADEGDAESGAFVADIHSGTLEEIARQKAELEQTRRVETEKILRRLSLQAVLEEHVTTGDFHFTPNWQRFTPYSLAPTSASQTPWDEEILINPSLFFKAIDEIEIRDDYSDLLSKKKKVSVHPDFLTRYGAEIEERFTLGGLKRADEIELLPQYGSLGEMPSMGVLPEAGTNLFPAGLICTDGRPYPTILPGDHPIDPGGKKDHLYNARLPDEPIKYIDPLDPPSLY